MFWFIFHRTLNPLVFWATRGLTQGFIPSTPTSRLDFLSRFGLVQRSLPQLADFHQSGIDYLFRYHALYLTTPSMPETALCMSTSLSNSFRARSALVRLAGLMILIATGLPLARCRPDNHKTVEGAAGGT